MNFLIDNYSFILLIYIFNLPQDKKNLPYRQKYCNNSKKKIKIYIYIYIHYMNLLFFILFKINKNITYSLTKDKINIPLHIKKEKK
ncbi:hypothetical protein PFMC_04382 [Plasmodium falciparum CAMP/Malaysia]|uniref:Uncharacterized protein n=1 Tax=Plasmodium falciparum (isolate Camp / Malaysia) TaxID=5835 RepID=A0A024X228_PLAFC|nr:hypothetical protein PFMC_04382 [Plasmodium falciparum CAMP/Malaysia]